MTITGISQPGSFFFSFMVSSLSQLRSVAHSLILLTGGEPAQRPTQTLSAAESAASLSFYPGAVTALGTNGTHMERIAL